MRDERARVRALPASEMAVGSSGNIAEEIDKTPKRRSPAKNLSLWGFWGSTEALETDNIPTPFASAEHVALSRPLTRKRVKKVQETYIIERILKSRFSKGGKKKEYKIRWKGYVSISYPIR
jgi:hypothetical protein